MADEVDPNKITDLSQAMEQRGLEKAHSDLRVSILEEARKREELSAEHSWNYEIGDRVVTAETANLPNPTPWKIIGKYINEKGLLEGSKPREGKLIEGLNVPYYRVSRIEDVGTPEEGEHITALPEWAIQNKFGTPVLVSDKPPPSDPRSTALVPLDTAPSAEDPAKEKAWKPSLKGLGSFVRSLATKGSGPLLQGVAGGLGALQDVWDNLSQEKKEEIVKQSSALEEGLQASRDERLGTELEGGIAALSVDEKSRMARAEQQGFGSEIYYHGTAVDISEFDLNHPDRKDQGWLGTGVYMTDSPYLASSYSIMSPGDSRNVIPLRVRLKNPYYATLEEKQKMMLRMHNKSKVEAREIADAWTADLQERGHDGVILQYDPKDVGEVNVVREVVVFDPKNIRSSFAKFDPAQSKEAGLSNAEGGLVETSELIPELVSKAHGGFIDKPLYERTL